MSVKLYITLEPSGGGRPVTVARIADRGVLLDAAEAAIREAQGKVETLAEEDERLGFLQKEEVARLCRSLEGIIPELRERNRVN